MSGVWAGLDEDGDSYICMCVREGPGRDHRETVSNTFLKNKRTL